MNEHSITSQPLTPVPADNPRRNLKVARPDTDQSLPHIGLVGDTYTVLLSGGDTNGRYCLIDMHIPPGGGPPPHRHDFEESFTITEGEIEATFRGEKSVVCAGETLSFPANAPHSFTNATDQPARLLCICAPAGQEAFFAQVGVPVATRTTPPPKPDTAGQAALMKKSQELAPKYRTELLKPVVAAPSRASCNSGSDATQHLQTGYAYAGDRFQDAVEEYPLAVAVGFLGIGLLTGLLLPRTRQEDKLIGEKSDQLIEQVKETGKETLDKAKAVAQRVATTTMDEAKRQGITPEAAGDKISEIAGKVSAVASQAKEEALRAAEEEQLKPTLETERSNQRDRQAGA